MGLMLRVPVNIFYMILDRVRPEIKKEKTNFRLPISEEERLSLTLKYLGSGEWAWCSCVALKKKRNNGKINR